MHWLSMVLPHGISSVIFFSTPKTKLCLKMVILDEISDDLVVGWCSASGDIALSSSQPGGAARVLVRDGSTPTRNSSKGPGMLFVSVKLLVHKTHRATLEESNKINKTANSCFALGSQDASAASVSSLRTWELIKVLWVQTSCDTWPALQLSQCSSSWEQWACLCWVPCTARCWSPAKAAWADREGLGLPKVPSFGVVTVSALGAGRLWWTTDFPPDHQNRGGHTSMWEEWGVWAPALSSISGIAKSHFSLMLCSKTSCFTLLAWSIKYGKLFIQVGPWILSILCPWK